MASSSSRAFNNQQLVPYAGRVVDSNYDAKRIDPGTQPLTIVALGSTGSGKSQFLEFISNIDNEAENAFEVSAGADAATTMTRGVLVEYRQGAQSKRTLLVDTPGLADTDNRDAEHMTQMVQYLKTLHNVGMFVLVFNSEAPRFDHNLKMVLEVYVDSFGPSFFGNVALMFSRWCMSEEAMRKRLLGAKLGSRQQLLQTGSAELIRLDHQVRNKVKGEFNRHIFEHFGLDAMDMGGHDRPIPCFFMDCAPMDAQSERESNTELQKLGVLASTLKSFDCEPIKTGQSRDAKAAAEKQSEGKALVETLISQMKSLDAKVDDLQLKLAQRPPPTPQQPLSSNHTALFNINAGGGRRDSHSCSDSYSRSSDTHTNGEPIHIGPQGGRYWIGSTGRKNYI